MVQALLDIRITYLHISGAENNLADALSRMHLSPLSKSYAIRYLIQNSIVYVDPVLDVFKNFEPPMFSRSGVSMVPGTGCTTPGELQGRGYHQEPT